MSERWAWTRPRGMRVALELALVAVGGLACLGISGYLAMDVTVPAEMAGDHLFLTTMAKSYLDGHGFRLNPSLGYPQVQDYLYFPVFEFTQRALLWLAAQVTRNPFSAVHGYYICGIVGMYAATLWSLRWLGVRWAIAAVGAIGYVVSPFLMVRAFGHDFLALYYAAPLGLALALKIGTSPAPASLRAFLTQPFVIVAALIAASSGIYYGFFSLMFISFAAVAAALNQRSWGPLRTGGVLVAAMLVVLMISGFGLDLFKAFSGAYPQPPRAAWEELSYGLDLPSAAGLFQFTPAIRQGFAAAISQHPEEFSSDGGAEFPGFVLTLVLLLSPLIAAAAPFAATRRTEAGEGAGTPSLSVDDPRLRLLGFAGFCATFGLIYAARGGLGFVFNLLVSPQIRATARIMPFLAFCALVVLCIGADLAANSGRRWLRLGAPILVCALLLGSTWHIRGALAKSQMARYDAPASRAFRTSVPAMLVVKNRIGAVHVLELPITHWPEGPAQSPGLRYTDQLPYIYDRVHSPTKWSYGANPAQPGFTLRQFVLAQPQGLAGRARAYGYDAVLVQKFGYGADGPATFAAIGQSLGARCRVYDDAVYTLYTLKTGGDGRPCGAGA